MRYKNSPDRLKENLLDGVKYMFKPHEYQLLMMSVVAGVGIEKIMGLFGVDVKDIPSDFLSVPILAGGVVTTLLSAYKFSTGEEGDVSSRARVDEIMRGLWQEGDILKGACDMMESTFRDNKTQEKAVFDELLNLKNRLKYAYLTNILLVSYVVRGEKGSCFSIFKSVCDDFDPEEEVTAVPQLKGDDELIDRESCYVNFFKRALKDIYKSGNFHEPMKSNNISLIIEVINKMEDYYNGLFVEFSQAVGFKFSTVEEALVISDRTAKPEVAALDFLKAKARKRKAWFYGLIALSAASLNRTEDIAALDFINQTLIADFINYLATHANMIVGTTATFISLRAAATINSSLPPAQFLARRLAPHTARGKEEEGL